MKEIKTKEKLEDRIKSDHDQMEKIKSELSTTKNNFKKSETNMEKLMETLKDLKVMLNLQFFFSENVLSVLLLSFRFWALDSE